MGARYDSSMSRGPIGRDQELADLVATLATAAAGDGQIVEVVGDAGIGKSTLLDALVARAVVEGARVWRHAPTRAGDRTALVGSGCAGRQRHRVRTGQDEPGGAARRASPPRRRGAGASLRGSLGVGVGPHGYHPSPRGARARSSTHRWPLYAVEIARLVAPGTVSTTPWCRPSLRATLRSRVDALPQATVAVLRAAALLAVPRIDLLAAALPEIDVLAACAAAEVSGIVTIGPQQQFDRVSIWSCSVIRCSPQLRSTQCRRSIDAAYTVCSRTWCRTSVSGPPT